MSKRPMPDWMMQYVSNIGKDECYGKFRELSKQFYQELDDPDGSGGKSVARLEMLNINRVYKEGNSKPKSDRDEFNITEKYKKKSRELAHEQGYDTKDPLEKLYENDPTLDNRKQLSREDRIAKSLHKEFGEKYPEKAVKAKGNENKYRERELYEIDASRSAENDTRGFNIAQDKFEEMRKSKAEKDEIDPDDNGSSGSAKKVPKEADKSDTAKYNISSRFFTSLGIDQNKLEQLSNKSTKQDKEIDTEKQNPSERFFKDIGFTVHNSDITKNRNTDKSTTANKVSISFSFDKASTKSPDKSVDLDKD